MATKVPNNLLNTLPQSQTTNLTTDLAAKLPLAGGTMTGSVGIGSAPDANALLTLTSTTKGFLPPRMTTAEITAMGVVTSGMVVFNTTLGVLQTYA